MSKVNQYHNLNYNEDDGCSEPKSNRHCMENKTLSFHKTSLKVHMNICYDEGTIPWEKTKFEPSGIKKNAITRPITNSHLKIQKLCDCTCR